ncbi:MAG TPA: peptidase T [Rhodothermales bacterium]|nr:peptidase T [Rhodothermales bacterium]
MPLPAVAERFLRYVQIDTQSDPDSEATPSTEKQKDLSRLLAQELRELGVADAEMDEYGYVFGTIPSTLPPEQAARTPTLALLAHVDTSPDASGANVKPVVHSNYDGGVLTLPGDPSVMLSPDNQPALLDHLGHDIITSDGTTLLGSDDKAGVAILMQLAEVLLHDRSIPCPPLRICFTVDEEIGQGVDKLDLDKLGADVAYTLDGSSTDVIYAETFNAAEAIIVVEGVMVHPGYAKGIMVNAVRILAEFIALLPATEAPETTADREGYIHPHTIAAGDATRAEVKLILRDFTTEGLERRKRLVKAFVEALRIQHPDATITLTVKDQYKNMRSYIEDKDPRVISLAYQAAQKLGIQLDEEVIRGGTDGARLSELGLPTPNVFNGGHAYHSHFEWNTVQNLKHSLAYTLQLVRTWAEHGAN